MEREIKIPETPAFLANVAHLLSFRACFTQWVDNEPAFRPPSKSLVAHRALKALEGDSPTALLRDADWKFICDTLESTEVYFVPVLSMKSESGEEQKLELPPYVSRLYTGAIVDALPILTQTAQAAE
jgi:hypothetical protein